MKILLVGKNAKDDENILRMLDQIEDVHVTFECAAELSAVSSFLTKSRPEVLVLDLAEENGGGPAILGKIIALAHAIPVIVLTKSYEDIHQYCEDSRFRKCEFLAKDLMRKEDFARSIRHIDTIRQLSLAQKKLRYLESIIGQATIGVTRDKTDSNQVRLQHRESLSALTAEPNSMSEANKLLSLQAMKLQIHASQMECLIELGEYLQVCNTEEEAYEVIAKFGSKLFSDSSGALYIFKESRNWLELVASWGERSSVGDRFPVDDCWSVRRSQTHAYSVEKPDPFCPHVEVDTTSGLCVPLVLLGEVFGIMNVQWTRMANEEEEKLVARLTGDAALALANLKLRKQLQELSVRDPLTGLFNRRYMEEFFEQELIRSRRKSGQLSILMLDIDHFKLYNDKFGHQAGDTVLHELGNFFKRQMRGSDVICRFGGEEFIVLLPEASSDAAEHRAHQLSDNAKLLQVKYDGQDLPPINLSIGVATFPSHGDCMEEIIRAADSALYKAKEDGRDRVCRARTIGIPEQKRRPGAASPPKRSP